MGLQARLRTRVVVLVAIGSLAVAAGVSLLLGNTVILRNTSDASTDTSEYLLHAVGVERRVVDVETGLRGYVITGHTLFLAPLRAAEQQLPASLAGLARAASENHVFQAQANSLIIAVRAYVSDYVPQVLALVKSNPAAARSLSVNTAGKRAVDGIRARTAMLEGLLSRSQVARQQRADSSASHSIIEAIVVLVLLTLLTALVGGFLAHLAVERDRARERSERTTRSLQESILPTNIPTIPSCQLAIRFTPAGDGSVGGDFYDVFEMSDGRWGVLVGDVCGKGAEAAAVSAMARWTLRSLTGAITKPEDGLRFLNDAMLRQQPDGRFITIAFLLVEVNHNGADALVACAGHPAPVFVPARGEPRQLDADGDLLGVWPSVRIHPARIELGPGDSLVVYTDGVTDQGPGPVPSPEQTLGQRPEGADADRLASMLEELAVTPKRPQRDDIAVLALRFLGKEQSEPDAPSVSGSPLVIERT